MLTKTVNELKAKLQPAVDSNNTSQPANLICLGHPAPVTTAVLDPSPKEKVSQTDYKSNIVISGIKECPKGTSKLDCFKKDLDSVADILHSVDPDFHKQNICDCFRLGKFKENLTCP